MIRLRNAWLSLTGTFWFVPALMMLAATLLFAVTTWIDHELDSDAPFWLYTGNPVGARSLLETIAQSMITVAGVVFSITVVALTVASAQFGPSLLRNFMRDTANQVVLGTFLAGFLYSLLVMRGVRTAEDRDIVPNVSITVAVFLALAGIAVLIYFIHHVPSSLTGQNVVARVADQLSGAITRMFPEKVGVGGRQQPDDKVPVEIDEGLRTESAILTSSQGGYLQAVDSSALLASVCDADAVLRLTVRPGDFLIEGQPIGQVWPAGRLDQLEAGLGAAFVVGSERTLYQDAMFGMQQLVEVAVRALSPGVNLPFLAELAVDRVSAALAQLADRDMPSPLRYDSDQRLRVIAPTYSYTDFVKASIGSIRRHSMNSFIVRRRLIEAITALSSSLNTEEQREALIEEVRFLDQVSDLTPAETLELRSLAERALQSLGASGADSA